MVTRSNIDLLLNIDERLQRPNCNLDERVQGELEFMLQAQRNQRIIDRERDLNVYRSGSAPPTVEGSLKAVRSLFGNNNLADFNDSVYGNGGVDNAPLTEDDIRSHPAYLSYYYSHDNINPRLPPPLLSKEDWRVAQRFHAGGGSSLRDVGDLRRKVIDDNDGSSLFSMQPGLSAGQAEQELMELRNAVRNNFARQGSVEWVDKGSDGLIGLQGSGLGARRKSFADILQEGLDQPSSFLGHLSRPSSVNAFGEYVDPSGISEVHPAVLHNEVDSLEQQLRSGATLPSLMAVQDHNTTLSHSFSSAVGSSLSRSTTPEQKLIGRSTPGLPPVGSRVGSIENKNTVGGAVQNGHAPGINELGALAAKFSGLSMSNLRHEDKDGYGLNQVQIDLSNQPDFTFNMPGASKQSFHGHFIENPNAENYPHSTNFVDMVRNEAIANLNASKMSPDGGLNIPKRTSSSVNLLSKANSASIENFDALEVHQNVNIPGSDFISHSSGAYPLNQSLVNSHLGAGGSGIGGNLHRVGNQGGLDLHPPMMDPRYTQYLQRISNHRTRTAGSSSSPQIRNFFGTSSGELEGSDKAFIEALLAQQKQQYELSLLVQSGGLKEGYYKNPSPGFGMPYPRNPLPNSAGFRNFQNEQVAQLASLMKSSLGGSIGSRHTDTVNNVEKKHVSSLLDEFKNNKAWSFELSDIVDHVVEFSTDQYGSRFIQQKLETASVEEKNNIFPEIRPHARTLMTDVFGNYVIQKFFEHGTESQRVELASQLTGHVLPLSLQMYGCRVIQKALEVVDVDLQRRMVAELDGSIMKCVRDQNGNHVIQKCIECVPEDQIQFIISSFYGQVVALSMHPYGCRVIQRVLEHCRDTNTQEIIMEEIMQAVCILAQDQYGNYVIQHVLEHGKPHIRSAVISKLAGQIVKMSQQKFASNVVERCLTFGGPEERQILVNEMLGSTDENEPLQAMMKDPFGNYVVQKVIETCDDQSLQLILSRIRVHFNTLKRYTYGKHIVSRVEKLIATGERRIGLSSSLATSQAT